MSRLVLLWFTIFIGPFFLLIEWPDKYITPFPYSDQELSLQMHVWYICARLSVVVFAWIILDLSDKYKAALWVFFGCKVIVLADYLLCYNEVWVYVWPGIPVTSNILSLLVFSLAIFYESLYRERSN